MHRYLPALLIALAAPASFAAGHGDEPAAGGLAMVTTPPLEMSASAAPQRALPPLPPLASLPPPAEVQPRAMSRSHNARRVAHPTARVSVPEIHLLVSDQSRDYLHQVDGQLDEALRK